jgi:hypothetical protein
MATLYIKRQHFGGERDAIGGLIRVTKALLNRAVGTGVLALTTLARGGNVNLGWSTAIDVVVEGQRVQKAADTATGVALAAATVPADTWGIWALQVDALGTATTVGGAANGTTGYASEAAAIAALPAAAAGNARIGYVTVLTADGDPFVAGTSALQGGTGGDPSSDTNYYSEAVSAILTPVNDAGEEITDIEVV